MELTILLLVFIAGATVLLLLVDGVSEMASRALVAAFRALRGGTRTSD
jgi:hypothetical protein